MPAPSAPLDPDQRLPDGGLPYAETDLSALIKEPWNTASLIPFGLIIAYWAWHLEFGRRDGRWRQHRFLASSLPIIGLSLIGGLLYHGTRSSRLWLVLDWLPIATLLLAVAVHQWWRVLRGRWRLLAYVLPLASLGLGGLLWRSTLPIQARINLNYAFMASIVLLPLGLRLGQTRGRHGAWVVGAVACFAAAVACRALDRELLHLLPMGTHWLWHVLGAGATACLAAYLYRSERDGHPSMKGR